jgi:proprotein convertase subtilisin/kexin type 5
LTTLCGTTCPSGTYQNIYSKTCLPCASTCGECLGAPDACTACQSSQGNIQYYYNGNCYSSCPSNTYLVSDQCFDCDASVNCKTCDMAATNCTSCLNGLFLDNPTSGACSSTCPNPTYSIKDVINF